MLAYHSQITSSPSDPRAEPHNDACVANISPRERLKRLAGGIIPFVIALAFLAALLVLHADRWWRLPLFILFMAATVGFFQWRDKT